MKRIVIILLAVSLATTGCEQDDFPFSMEGPFEMPGGQQAATNLKDPGLAWSADSFEAIFCFISK